MLLKKFEEYGGSVTAILRRLASKGEEGVRFHWSTRDLYQRLEADGYLTIEKSFAKITEEALQEIQPPARAPIPSKPKRVVPEHEEYIQVTTYSEGEEALADLLARQGR